LPTASFPIAWIIKFGEENVKTRDDGQSGQEYNINDSHPIIELVKPLIGIVRTGSETFTATEIDAGRGAIADAVEQPERYVIVNWMKLETGPWVPVNYKVYEAPFV